MIDADEQVILVDEDDREIGLAGKLEAHRAGALHRAISIFVFNANGDLILQRRAPGKYHSGGQWANTCCSHPRPGEDAQHAAHRRLPEELGFDCELSYRAKIRYRADVGSGLVENEMVSAYVGRHLGDVAPVPDEVSEWRAVAPSRLVEEIEEQPELFTPWLRIYMRDHRGALFDRLAEAVPIAAKPTTPDGGPTTRR